MPGKLIKPNAADPKINNTTYATLFQTTRHSCITVRTPRIDATIENQSKPSLVMLLVEFKYTGCAQTGWYKRD